MKILLLIAISSCLSGCALTLEMMAITGLSYLATGKSLSDNALSVVTNKDCALHRIIVSQDICIKNKLDSEVMTAQNKIELSADLSSTVLASFPAEATHDFSVAPAKAPLSAHQGPQRYAVVGSFNNYQYAQARNKKYLDFDSKIITNKTHSSSKYRVVVGPIKQHNFIAKLPIMVGAETQLPWEITLCANDMSPPPCNNKVYTMNIDKQRSAKRGHTPMVPVSSTLR